MGRARCRNFFGLFARLPPWRSPAPALHFLWISLRPNQTDPSPCGFPMPTMCELDCKQSQGCKRVRNSNSLATSLPCQGILWGLQGKWFQQSTRLDSIADSVFVKIGWVGQILRRLPRPLPQWCRIFWGPQLSDWCLKVPFFDWLALPHE